MKRIPTWWATAATKSFSPTRPSLIRSFERGTPSFPSRSSICSRTSRERTLRSTRNSPKRRDAACMSPPIGSGGCCLRHKSGQSDDHPEDLLHSSHTVANLDETGLAEGEHSLCQRKLLDVLGVAVLDDDALDFLGHEQHFVDGESAVIAGLPAGLAPDGPEE